MPDLYFSSINFRFCVNENLQSPKFLIKMDDDTIVNYAELQQLLDKESEVASYEKHIFCPSVLRNQKLWVHKDAPIMGKWAYMNENYTDYSKCLIWVSQNMLTYTKFVHIDFLWSFAMYIM